MMYREFVAKKDDMVLIIEEHMHPPYDVDVYVELLDGLETQVAGWPIDSWACGSNSLWNEDFSSRVAMAKR